MALFGGDTTQTQTQKTDTKNVSVSDNSAPAFGMLSHSPVLNDTAAGTFISGRDLSYNIKQVDPGALDAFNKAADVTLAALAAVERSSAAAMAGAQAQAENQSKSLKDFATSSGQPDKGIFSENIKWLLLAALAGLALVELA
jgi:hypothetical protein